MGAIMPQITSLTIVNSTVYSSAVQRKHQKLCVTGFRDVNSPVTGKFPAQRASNVEIVAIGWRLHDFGHIISCSNYVWYGIKGHIMIMRIFVLQVC